LRDPEITSPRPGYYATEADVARDEIKTIKQN